jgi:hypothetical protein
MTAAWSFTVGIFNPGASIFVRVPPATQCRTGVAWRFYTESDSRAVAVGLVPDICRPVAQIFATGISASYSATIAIDAIKHGAIVASEYQVDWLRIGVIQKTPRGNERHRLEVFPTSAELVSAIASHAYSIMSGGVLDLWGAQFCHSDQMALPAFGADQNSATMEYAELFPAGITRSDVSISHNHAASNGGLYIRRTGQTQRIELPVENVSDDYRTAINSFWSAQDSVYLQWHDPAMMVESGGGMVAMRGRVSSFDSPVAEMQRPYEREFSGVIVLEGY